MHETKSPLIKGYIDNFYNTEFGYRISGWLVSEVPRDSVTYYMNIGHDIAFYNYNQRQDVADFYQNQTDDYIRCGFDVTLPRVTEEIVIFAMVKGVKEEIFRLNTSNEIRIPPVTTIADEKVEIKIRNNIVPELIVIDNFYQNPDEVRKLALQQEFEPDIRYHKGKRTKQKFIAPGTKQLLESLIGRKITNWTEYNYNGIFQYCTAEDPIVYHSDMQSYAAAVYLTPDAPVDTGTSFYRSKAYPEVRSCHVSDPNYNDVFKGGYYDKTQFELVDTVGNVYNRLAIWNSKLIHSATQYFGQNKDDSRLFHLFFFDIEE